jgi:hypothetical protein
MADWESDSITKKPAEQSRPGKAKAYPYRTYEDLPIWSIVSKSVMELVNNGDLREITAHPYIVGSICKSIIDAQKLVSGGAAAFLQAVFLH